MSREVPMSVRRLIVEVDLDGLNVTAFCRDHGISTWFFYQLRKRFELEGEAALEPRSRAPRTVPNRTAAWIEDAVVELRKELTDDGLDAGPATILFHLPSRVGSNVRLPSESTIWRILSRRGFIVPEPDKAPKHAYRTFAADRANECWQLDDILWELADGRRVFVITLLDDCTRFCPGLKAVPAPTGAAALDAMCQAAQRHGWPQRFLSDNAKAYKETLAAAVGKLGVDHRHGRPHHPQTQGKVERFHQTLQKWLRAQPQAATVDQLQTQLDEFTIVYNTQRPHRALGRNTPTSVYQATPKAGPADRPLGTPTRISRVTVSNGVCYLSKGYTITVGAAHNGATATVIVTNLTCHIFINGTLIRHFTLDPTRRFQPLYDRPGRP